MFLEVMEHVRTALQIYDLLESYLSVAWFGGTMHMHPVTPQPLS
jgi:hypothetical protein